MAAANPNALDDRIARAAAEIRAKWTDEEKLKRGRCASMSDFGRSRVINRPINEPGAIQEFSTRVTLKTDVNEDSEADIIFDSEYWQDQLRNN